VGDDAEIEALPPAPIEVRKPIWIVPTIGGVLVLVVILVLAVLRC
jgi:hypothetical protein